MTRDELLRRYAAGERNFRGADLRGADLGRANLSGANLSGTVLDPLTAIPAPSPTDLEAAGFTVEGSFVIGWRTRRSSCVGSTDYAPGTAHVAPVFSRCKQTECHPGLYLWPTRERAEEWLREYSAGEDVVRVATPIAELMRAGGKWRCRRLLVLPEVDE